MEGCIIELQVRALDVCTRTLCGAASPRAFSEFIAALPEYGADTLCSPGHLLVLLAQARLRLSCSTLPPGKMRCKTLFRRLAALGTWRC